MGDTEVKHQRHRTRRIREVTGQLDVPTSLTTAASHLLRFHFVCCAKKVSKLINSPVVRLLGTRVGSTSAERCQGVNLKLQPQDERGKSARAGISAPIQEAKKVCQRLVDQASSLRCGLIWVWIGYQ